MPLSLQGSRRSLQLTFILTLLAAALAAATFGTRRAEAQRGSCAPLDLALIVDTTGSMGGAIDNVREGLNRIIDEANTVAAGNLRLSLTTFKDNVVVERRFADNNEGAVRSSVNALSADGGGNEPEASDEALNTVVNALPASARAPGQQTGDFRPPFRSGAQKIAVMITDARPGGFDDSFDSSDRARAVNYARQARAKGIRISSVYVPVGGVESTERDILRAYARESRGEFRQTRSDGQGTAAAIRATIASCGGIPRLRVTPSPRRQREDGRRCFTFTVRSGKTRIANATVRFAGRRARTNRRGRVRICRYFGRPGAKRVTASRRGFRSGANRVFITRAPRFTG